MPHPVHEIWLIRHGETEWSLSGAHTSRTDIPLTDKGRDQASALAPILANHTFDLVMTSPRTRAQETCRLAGLDANAVVDPNLQEWDYGIFEGKTTAEIRKQVPGWSVWKDEITDGETLEEVSARAEAVIERALSANGPVALFAHAHILRILAGCWVADGAFGEHLVLGTASVSVLGFEREARAILRWNQQHA